jgi:hypothetical protein
MMRNVVNTLIPFNSTQLLLIRILMNLPPTSNPPALPLGLPISQQDISQKIVR